MTTANLKRTALYSAHVKLGARMVPFAGWEMPVQYAGVIPEHRTVRTAAGLFDVSHMGEVFVYGPHAEAALNQLTCNDVTTLTDGKALYSAILNERGGVVDDIIIYRYNKEKYLICVNASNAEKDFNWFREHDKLGAKFVDASSQYGQLALQGPKAEEILALVPGGEAARKLAYFHFAEMEIAGVQVIVARTGYTGEDGFEIFIPYDSTPELWSYLLEVGAKDGLAPIGLGARDSLRLEACYPLHGHELGDDISALESGLGWIVKFNKSDFIGKAALLEQKAKGLKRSLAGFFVEDAGIVREGEKIYADDGSEIGVVTSGTKTPTLNVSLGLALIDSQHAAIGSIVNAEVRGKKLKCRIVKKPFYKREGGK